MPTAPTKTHEGLVRTLGRWLLGAVLAGVGVTHLTTARREFLAQVPSWVPMNPDHVVLASGALEIGLGLALVTQGRRRHQVGWAVAAFFVAIFPGNIAQYVEGNDGFGLDTDTKRLIRLFFQPLLVAWTLWSTGAWRARRETTSADASENAAEEA